MTAFAARALETMGVAAARADTRTVVVVGNGMVGHRFCERLATHDRDRRLRIVCFGEERRAAYDRVHLTAYMSGKNADALVLADAAWYASCGITLHLGERVIEIDRTARTVVSSAGRRVAYDALVLATGSAPFVPAIPGVETPGVFVYRTIEDLDAIRAWSARARRAAVIGGGLLGLEAAKAVHDLSLEVGLVGPGYEMAEVAARRLCGDEDASFAGADLSTKLKLMGVDVASFGDAFADEAAGGARPVVFEDRVRGVYQKLVVSEDGRRLVGGILVGDAEPYPALVRALRDGHEVPARPHELLFGAGGGAESATA